jgi:hypothetical protein
MSDCDQSSHQIAHEPAARALLGQALGQRTKKAT